MEKKISEYIQKEQKDWRDIYADQILMLMPEIKRLFKELKSEKLVQRAMGNETDRGVVANYPKIVFYKNGIEETLDVWDEDRKIWNGRLQGEKSKHNGRILMFPHWFTAVRLGVNIIKEGLSHKTKNDINNYLMKI